MEHRSNERMDHIEQNMMLIVTAVNTVGERVGQLDERIGQLDERMGQLDERMEGIERGQQISNEHMKHMNSTLSRVDSTLSELHRDFHRKQNFTRRRLMSLKSATAPVSGCNVPYGAKDATGHAVHFNGSVAMLTVAHNDCGGAVPPSFIQCPGFDLAVRADYCPLNDTNVKHLLDITDIADIHLGDEAVAFGYVYENNEAVDRGWRGTVMGKLGFTMIQPAFCGSNSTTFNKEEHFASGAQFPGMSGGPAANGCGYLGLAHAKRSDLEYSAVLIPAIVIQKFLMNVSRLLQTMESCGYTAEMLVRVEASPSCPNIVSRR